jgi:hypothetical protein
MLLKLLTLAMLSAITTGDCFYRSIIGYEEFQKTHFEVYAELIAVQRPRDPSILVKLDSSAGVTDVTSKFGLEPKPLGLQRVYYVPDSALRMQVIRDLAPHYSGLLVKVWGEKYVGDQYRMLQPSLTIEAHGHFQVRERLTALSNGTLDEVHSSGHGNISYHTAWFKPEAMERMPWIYEALRADSNVIEVHLGLVGIGPAMLD